jgi:hypothetical protein
MDQRKDHNMDEHRFVLFYPRMLLFVLESSPRGGIRWNTTGYIRPE